MTSPVAPECHRHSGQGKVDGVADSRLGIGGAPVTGGRQHDCRQHLTGTQREMVGTVFAVQLGELHGAGLVGPGHHRLGVQNHQHRRDIAVIG